MNKISTVARKGERERERDNWLDCSCSERIINFNLHHERKSFIHAFLRFNTTAPNPLHISKLEVPIEKILRQAKEMFCSSSHHYVGLPCLYIASSPSTPPKESATIECSTSHSPFFVPLRMKKRGASKYRNFYLPICLYIR
jgi:hypothetical protein